MNEGPWEIVRVGQLGEDVQSRGSPERYLATRVGRRKGSPGKESGGERNAGSLESWEMGATSELGDAEESPPTHPPGLYLGDSSSQNFLCPLGSLD